MGCNSHEHFKPEGLEMPLWTSLSNYLICQAFFPMMRFILTAPRYLHAMNFGVNRIRAHPEGCRFGMCGCCRSILTGRSLHSEKTKIPVWRAFDALLSTEDMSMDTDHPLDAFLVLRVFEKHCFRHRSLYVGFTPLLFAET
jgi:hypothetical protein